MDVRPSTTTKQHAQGSATHVHTRMACTGIDGGSARKRCCPWPGRPQSSRRVCCCINLMHFYHSQMTTSIHSFATVRRLHIFITATMTTAMTKIPEIIRIIMQICLLQTVVYDRYQRDYRFSLVPRVTSVKISAVRCLCQRLVRYHLRLLICSMANL